VTGVKKEVVEDGVEGVRGEDLRANIVQVSSGAREVRGQPTCLFRYGGVRVTGNKNGYGEVQR
jgi:hypothetical protein